jgi:regulator of sigma E protease
MAAVENAGWFLVAVFILVTFHELGHFSVARLLGVGVSKFSVGFGRHCIRFGLGVPVLNMCSAYCLSAGM